MARRTRRPPVAWLPLDRDLAFRVAGTNNSIGTAFVELGSAGIVTAGCVPLVLDSPPLPALGDTIADIEGSAYRLRRIVGKIWCSAAADDDADIKSPINSICSAGLIVLRCDSLGDPLVALGAYYSPLVLDNASDPWIWRRSWLLSNAFSGGVNQNLFYADFPLNNADYGSIQDGPHVDAKTARIIGEEERLYLVITTMALDGTVPGANSDARFWWDLRILGTMKRTQGNRRNASR